jgi:putative endonuclease
MMTVERKKLGEYGEKLALRHYELAGFSLVHRQYRCRMGEIDLIMRKRNVYYFVEVRTKTTPYFGTAEASITPQKRKTIRQVSLHFLQNLPNQQNDHHPAVQFDVVAISIDKQQKMAWIRRIPQAF